MTLKELQEKQRVLGKLITIEKKRAKLLSQLNGRVTTRAEVRAVVEPKAKHKPKMSKKERNAISQRMKTYWAEKRGGKRD